MFAILFIFAQTFYTTTPETVISWVPFLLYPWASLRKKAFFVLFFATIIQIVFFEPRPTLATGTVLLAPLVFQS